MSTVRDLVHRAECGDREAFNALKEMFPRCEFRRFHCDLNGPVLKCRGKGSKAPWKRP